MIRLPSVRHAARLALLLLGSCVCAASALAAWSHHSAPGGTSSVMPPVVNNGSTSVSTTTTIPTGFTGTLVFRGKTIHAYFAAGNGEFGLGSPTFAIQQVNPPSTSTSTTTVNPGSNGGSTTVVSTETIPGGPRTTTTSLANIPNIPNGGTVTFNIPGRKPVQVNNVNFSLLAPTVSNGLTIFSFQVKGTVTTDNLPFTFTETYQTVALAPVAPTATSTATTIPRGNPQSFPVADTAPQAGAPTTTGALAQVQAASEQTQAAIAACGVQSPACVADALDAYAAELEKLAPQLPPRLRTLPTVIRAAAQKVRVAKTKVQAVRAITTAIAQVRKTISLLRADDPVTASTGAREGAFVVETLQVASDKLQRATGL